MSGTVLGTYTEELIVSSQPCEVGILLIHEEPEAWRGQVTCLKPAAKKTAKLRYEN